MKQLKNEIIAFKNPDKGFHEKPDPKNPSNFPAPFRMCLCAKPNAGKTNIVKHIVIHQNPPFQRILIYHIDPQTREYDDMDGEFIDEIPNIEEIDPSVKNLLIIEDINLKSLKKEQKELLDRYMGYVSTHRNLSIIITAQRALCIPPNIRGLSNVICLWKTHDSNLLSQISGRIGLTPDEMKFLFKKYIKSNYDFICIDLTHGTNYSKNFFTPINDMD